MGHMAAAPQHLSLEEFDRLYGHDQKPYYEYWFGQAIQKPVPNIIHSLLQAIMAILLREIGLLSGPEVRLKLSSEAQPLPDVVGFSRIQLPIQRSRLKLPLKFFRHRIPPSISSASAAYMRNGESSTSLCSIQRTGRHSSGTEPGRASSLFLRLPLKAELQFQ
jgi:Putative restriction endonuclease